MISDGDLERRLRAIEKKLNMRYAGGPGGPMVTLYFYGGLLPEPIIATTDNGGEWFRNYPDESLEARCGKEASEMGAQRMLINSMPDDGERQCEVARAAHKIYLDRFYPEVPAEEPIGYRRPSPVMRAIGD
jgi:hypothetical protein